MMNLVGKKLQFKAVMGTRSNGALDKICLEHLTLDDLEVEDHVWVTFDEKRMKGLRKGDCIRFTAIIVEYVGLNKDGKRVDKWGINNVRSVERTKKWMK